MHNKSLARIVECFRIILHSVLVMQGPPTASQRADARKDGAARQPTPKRRGGRGGRSGGGNWRREGGKKDMEPRATQQRSDVLTESSTPPFVPKCQPAEQQSSCASSRTPPPDQAHRLLSDNYGLGEAASGRALSDRHDTVTVNYRPCLCRIARAHADA